MLGQADIDVSKREKLNKDNNMNVPLSSKTTSVNSVNKIITEMVNIAKTELHPDNVIIEKVEYVNKQPEIQKVEVVNKDVQKTEIVNFPIQKSQDLRFPKSFEISNLERIEKKLDELLQKTNEVQVVNPVRKVEIENPQTEIKITNLPLGEDQKPDKNKANPAKYSIVRLSDGRQFIDNLGGGLASVSSGKPMGDRIWLREEYTFTTISGSQVPTRVIKWDDQFKLTEDYQYDANANPIVKTRKLEATAGTGI